MTLTIELTPEQEAALKRQAEAAGMDATEYVRQLLTSDLVELHLPKTGAKIKEDDRQWDEQFAATPDEKLQKLVARVEEKIRDGKVMPMDFTRNLINPLATFNVKHYRHVPGYSSCNPMYAEKS